MIFWNSAWQHQQEISACDGAVHWGFHPHNGRGAPEIDILEAMSGDKIGVSFDVYRHRT